MTDWQPLYAIEKGVPIPPKRHALSGGSKYPWRQLEIGDSFLAPLPEHGDARKHHASMTRSACQWAKAVNREFTTRRVEGGVRVWRTK